VEKNLTSIAPENYVDKIKGFLPFQVVLHSENDMSGSSSVNSIGLSSVLF
jgi:hypothetical protein